MVVIENSKVLLIGGSEFEIVWEVIHHGVKSATVSPCERFICSFSPDPKVGQGKYVVWSIETGEAIREFEKDELSKETPDLFKWSFDGSYIAKLITDHICVYQLPDMKMILNETGDERKSIRVKGVKSFNWSPSKNIFYYEFSEGGAHPQYGFIDIPSRWELISPRILMNAVDTKVKWAEDGKHCILLVKYFSKNKYSNDVFVLDSTQKFKIGLITFANEVILAECPQNASILSVALTGKPVDESSSRNPEKCTIYIYSITSTSENIKLDLIT